jgi:hypothetical protein
MSFINANTANPTNSSQIGYTIQTHFSDSGMGSGTSTAFFASNTLTQGVWLINACVYMQTSGIMNDATLNIVYNNTPSIVGATYATESAVLYFAGSVGLLQAALNTMTVLYVGTTPYYYAVVVSATTTSGVTWNVLNNPPQYSVIRATKIA